MRFLALCNLGLLPLMWPALAAQEPVRVMVAHPIAHNPSHVEFAATMEPARSIAIRAPMTSKVAKVLVKPGARVKRGDRIMELDPGPALARMRQWDQAVERAETDVTKAQKVLLTSEQFAKLDAKELADLRTKEVRNFQVVGGKALAAWQDLALKNAYWKSLPEFRTARETLEQTLALCKARPPGTDPLAQVQRLLQAIRRLPAGPVPLDKECAERLANLTDILERLALLCRVGTPRGRDALQAEAHLAETVLKTNQEGRERARHALQQTKVLAPIDGDFIGHVKAGDSVEAGDRSATLLATIVQSDTVRATFEVDEGTFEELGKRKQLTHIALGRKEDKSFPFLGQIEFIDNRIDPKKNVAVVRALFSNEKGSLTEALLSADKKRQSVRVRLTLGENRKVVLVPRKVILSNPDGSRQVLVAKEKKLEIRPVKVGGEFAGMQIVTAGLSLDDLVIVGSARRDFKDQTLTPEDFATDVRLLRARPGTPVEPVLVVLPKISE